MGVHAGALMRLRHQKGFKNFFIIIVDNCDIHRVFHLIALKLYCPSHCALSPALSKETPWRTEIRNTTWVLGWIHADMGIRSTYAPNLQQMSSERLFGVYSFPANKVMHKKFNPQAILEVFLHTGLNTHLFLQVNMQDISTDLGCIVRAAQCKVKSIKSIDNPSQQGDSACGLKSSTFWINSCNIYPLTHTWLSLCGQHSGTQQRFVHTQ